MCYCQAELAEIWCINCNELFPFSFNDSWHSSVQPDTELIFQDFSKKTFTEVQFNHLQRLKCALKWSKFGKHQPLAHDRFIQKSSNICRNECVCLDATCKHLSGNSLQFYSLYNACNWLPYSCWPFPPNYSNSLLFINWPLFQLKAGSITWPPQVRELWIPCLRQQQEG